MTKDGDGRKFLEEGGLEHPSGTRTDFIHLDDDFSSSPEVAEIDRKIGKLRNLLSGLRGDGFSEGFILGVETEIGRLRDERRRIITK